jgi:beta-lactamase superfamily II metal-dependent hydrolase
MIFSLDLRRARKGDCFLLHFGSGNDPRLAIVDGGPRNVYGPHLKPRLQEIRNRRGLEGREPLAVDLLMVSHVDDDHIQGILDLTREALAAQTPPVSVLSFWHNSFEDLIAGEAKELTAKVAARWGEASLGAGVDAEAIAAEAEDEVAYDSLQVLASIAQGQRLRGDAEALGAPLNPEFDGQLIVAGDKPVPVSESLRFTVAGPMQPELDRLRKHHADWLRKRKDDSPEAALAAYADTSVANLSSIVVLAESGGKTMLLTGDARGDKILEGLELAGSLQQGGAMHVDVLKVPHHGSARNLERGFFERVTADHYVFSGNGEHGNPERESMEMLFAARRKEPFTIHLTYPIVEIDAAREADWEKERAKEIKRRDQGSQKPVREPWSDKEHSLAAFFKKPRLAKKQRIAVVGEAGPHVIDLLDPLGY